MALFQTLRGVISGCLAVGRLERSVAELREAVGRVESRQLAAFPSPDLSGNEFKVWSQWGEDGILQHLIRHVQVPNRVFVEFGVETYVEANTRFLLTQFGWSGLVLDGSEANIAAVRRDDIYWRHNLKAACAFITRENIDGLLAANGVGGPIGLLSIDIDGNDYWVWEAIQSIDPALVVVEYNSRFGSDRAVTIPYDPAFQRAHAHHSTSYYGASLAALVALGRRKGYAFVGSNSAGNNAFFVQRSRLPSTVRELTVAEGYVRRAFREMRDASGALVYPSMEEEEALVQSLPLVEVPK
jgi:hypothetical protein